MIIDAAHNFLTIAAVMLGLAGTLLIASVYRVLPEPVRTNGRIYMAAIGIFVLSFLAHLGYDIVDNEFYHGASHLLEVAGFGVLLYSSIYAVRVAAEHGFKGMPGRAKVTTAAAALVGIGALFEFPAWLHLFSIMIGIVAVAMSFRAWQAFTTGTWSHVYGDGLLTRLFLFAGVVFYMIYHYTNIDKWLIGYHFFSTLAMIITVDLGIELRRSHQRMLQLKKASSA